MAEHVCNSICCMPDSFSRTTCVAPECTITAKNFGKYLKRAVRMLKEREPRPFQYVPFAVKVGPPDRYHIYLDAV